MQAEHGAEVNPDPQRADISEDKTETVSVGKKSGDNEKEDVVTDPALDDRVGSDWTDEGGATVVGPATATPDSD